MVNGICAKPHLVLPTPDPGLDSDGMKAGGADLWTLQWFFRNHTDLYRAIWASLRSKSKSRQS